MTEVHFYHLTRNALEDVLPALLEKTLERKWRAVVKASSIDRVESLTHHLWVYRPDSFLPHGNLKDGNPAEQPIWLTTDDERPNAAEVLFLTDGATTAHHAEFERICEIFDGNNVAAINAARGRWAEFKELGYALNYWQQGEKGWTKQL